MVVRVAVPEPIGVGVLVGAGDTIAEHDRPENVLVPKGHDGTGPLNGTRVTLPHSGDSTQARGAVHGPVFAEVGTHTPTPLFSGQSDEPNESVTEYPQTVAPAAPALSMQRTANAMGFTITPERRVPSHRVNA